ncbi:MAG: hypothetical protein EOO20_25220, partial [Chryseobacterium sp.]
MKYLILCLALLSANLSYSQKLKLRKGQQFTYEYLDLRTYLYSTEHKSLNLSVYKFEVMNFKNNIYKMKMQLTRRIKYSSHNGRIDDTNESSVASSDKGISQVIDAVLAKSPFTFTMDTAGKVISFD